MIIKRFNEINESFNPQKDDNNNFKFSLNDVDDSVDLVNIRKSDIDDGSEFVYKPNTYGTRETRLYGHSYTIYTLYIKYKEQKYVSEFGWLVFEDDEPKYIVGIYEPHDYSVNEMKAVVTFYGHEEIILLWLEDGYYDRILTR